MTVTIGRREVLATLGDASLACPPGARGRQPRKLPTIGFLDASSATAASRNVNAFLQGMHGVGYVKGSDFGIEYRWAEGQQERLPTLAEELIRLKVDLILTGVV